MLVPLITAIPVLNTPSEGAAMLAMLDKQEQELEAQLKATKALRHELETDTLVQLFDLAEQDELTLSSGVKVKRGMKTTGSLPKVDEKANHFEQEQQKVARQAAMDLAVSYGWEPFIKTKVIAEYDKGDSEKASKAYMYLRGDNSAKVDMEESIHPMTLGAQVRQRLREGKDVAMDTLGVTVLPAVLLTKKQKG
jgi:hypothetical protein